MIVKKYYIFISKTIRITNTMIKVNNEKEREVRLVCIINIISNKIISTLFWR